MNTAELAAGLKELGVELPPRPDQQKRPVSRTVAKRDTQAARAKRHRKMQKNGHVVCTVHKDRAAFRYIETKTTKVGETGRSSIDSVALCRPCYEGLAFAGRFYKMKFGHHRLEKEEAR